MHGYLRLSIEERVAAMRGLSVTLVTEFWRIHSLLIGYDQSNIRARRHYSSFNRPPSRILYSNTKNVVRHQSSMYIIYSIRYSIVSLDRPERDAGRSRVGRVRSKKVACSFSSPYNRRSQKAIPSLVGAKHNVEFQHLYEGFHRLFLPQLESQQNNSSKLATLCCNTCALVLRLPVFLLAITRTISNGFASEAGFEFLGLCLPLVAGRI
jgi:hypothetical protein